MNAAKLLEDIEDLENSVTEFLRYGTALKGLYDVTDLSDESDDYIADLILRLFSYASLRNIDLRQIISDKVTAELKRISAGS